MSSNDPKKFISNLLEMIGNQSLYLKLGKGKEKHIYRAFHM